MIGIDVTLDQLKPDIVHEAAFTDQYLESYDRTSAVNLCSVMQSTVPEPYSAQKFSHLNMPGGSWGQQTKYLSHELNSSHYTALRQELRSDWSQYNEEEPKGISRQDVSLSCSLLKSKSLFDHYRQHHPFLTINKRFISLSARDLNDQTPKTSGESDAKQPEKETGGSKLKKAVREYGSTVIVFHVGMSLLSLGMFYTLVSRWVEIKPQVTVKTYSRQSSSLLIACVTSEIHMYLNFKNISLLFTAD